jgi:photosystem II stability/assembly factor-like uncharacterized protein
LLAVVSAITLASAALPAAAADLQWGSYGTLPGGTASFGLAQDPAAPAQVWAATMGSGLQKTEDGKTWRQVAPGILPMRLWKVAIDPSKGPAVSPPMYVGSAGQGLFKSLDGGKTWTGSTQGLSSPGSRNVRGIAMGVNVLVIGTSDGVYKSVDGGRIWQPAGLAGTDVSAIVFARYAGPATLLAGIDGVSNPGSRLVLSKDLGATWTPVKQGLPADIVISAIVAGTVRTDANLRTVFLAGSAGAFKSDDQGQSWGQLSGLPSQGYGSLAVSPADPNIVYVGGDGAGAGGGGVWRSADRGGTWTGLSGGLSEKGVTGLSVGRDNPATVIAAAWNPDKALAPVFALSDTQAPPSGQPEAGVCPEPSCQGGFQVQPSAPPVPSPSPSPSPAPCGAPSPSPSGSASPGAASPLPQSTASTPGATPAPSATPCPPARRTGSRIDIPVPLAVGALVVLGVLLIGSIVVTRVRG